MNAQVQLGYGAATCGAVPGLHFQHRRGLIGGNRNGFRGIPVPRLLEGLVQAAVLTLTALDVLH